MKTVTLDETIAQLAGLRVVDRIGDCREAISRALGKVLCPLGGPSADLESEGNTELLKCVLARDAESDILDPLIADEIERIKSRILSNT